MSGTRWTSRKERDGVKIKREEMRYPDLTKAIIMQSSRRTAKPMTILM